MNLSRHRLANGLTLLMLVDRSAPVVSYQTWFRVGSRHEKKGKTGLAHLFEHLMFNETQSLAAGEFDRLLETAGGETNAATWVDWTYYYENLPRNELPLVTRLEADRMSHLVLREKQLKSEKEVVANERRYRVDDDVEGAVNEKLYSIAFKKHPYHWPTIGWMKDIEGFTTADCRAFYKTYYAPNNACVVLVGDIDEKKAVALIEKSYGKLKSSKIPTEPKVKEPTQTAERKLVMKQATPTEKLQLGYRGPRFSDYDYAVLTVANEILVGGRSSRLYRTLVSEREIAAEVRASMSPFRDEGLYEIWASAREGYRAKDSLVAIERELSRIAKDGVSQGELEKAKNRLELGFLQGMETASGKAEQIGFYETVLGDPSRIFSRLEDYRRVSDADIRRVAKLVFNKKHRTTITVVPSGEASAEPDEGDDE
ncbi:MAG: insulinase family protein [Sandaracinaceae bacterium]|nr:insulinase family protein [Sandaracinaceae bacterium]